MCGYKLKDSGKRSRPISCTVVEKLVGGVLAAITTRFGDITVDLRSTEIASFKNWPSDMEGIFVYIITCIRQIHQVEVYTM